MVLTVYLLQHIHESNRNRDYIFFFHLSSLLSVLFFVCICFFKKQENNKTGSHLTQASLECMILLPPSHVLELQAYSIVLMGRDYLFLGT